MLFIHKYKFVIVLLSLLLCAVLAATAVRYFDLPIKIPYLTNRTSTPLTITNNNPDINVGLFQNNTHILLADLPFLSDKIQAVDLTITNQKQLFNKSWGKGLTFSGYSVKLTEASHAEVTIYLDAKLLRDSGWTTNRVAKHVSALLLESLLYLELTLNGQSGTSFTSDASYQENLQKELSEKTSEQYKKLDAQNEATTFWVEYAQ